MNINCYCGFSISDSTDYISYKARLLADQDYFDLLEGIDASLKILADAVGQSSATHDVVPKEVKQASLRIRDLLRKYLSRALYQCTACGRVYVEDATGNLHVLLSGEDGKSIGLLQSIEGKNWKRPLRGLWRQSMSSEDKGKGELWWGFGGDDEGFETFHDWEQFQHRYQEVFARLRSRDVLRDSFLSKDGVIVHQWPTQTVSSAKKTKDKRKTKRKPGT